MAIVLKRTGLESAPYDVTLFRSVNTVEFDPADWIINPDLSSVQGVATRYWSISGDTVSAVDQATRNARDAEIAALRAAAEKAEAEQEFDEMLAIRAVALTMLDAINTERTARGAQEITPAQLRNAVRTKIEEIG